MLEAYAGGNKAFLAWLQKVDAILASMIGISLLDLPDQHWFDWFEGGLTPASAAKRVRKYEGF